MSEQRFTLPAFAKINLALRVLGRRPDGFHEIETIFQTVTLHDLLTFETTHGEHIELTCNVPHVPVDESNLVHRAAVVLSEKHHVRRGAHLHLEKRIPVGGGLGGGSADAAMALLGLARLWKLELSKAELVEIGARLGADVPFFFTGGAALGTGLGTEITALDEAPLTYLIIVTPNVQVSTAKAYAALRAPALTKADVAAILPGSRTTVSGINVPGNVLVNDFEPVVFSLQPVIKRAKDMLLAFGADKALLAGSGASIFGIFDSREKQERAFTGLKATVDWQVFTCRTLTRSEYKQALGICGSMI